VVASWVIAAADAANMVFAQPAGVVAGAFDRRKVMLAGQAVGLAATIAMAVLAFVVGLPVGPVFAAGAFIEGGAVLFAESAGRITVADLAPKEQVREAVQWDVARGGAANTAGTFVGPVLAQWSVWAPFGLNVASYVQFLVTVSRLYKRIPASGQQRPRTVSGPPRGLRGVWSRVARELRRGWTLVWADPLLRADMLISTLCNLSTPIVYLRATTAIVPGNPLLSGAIMWGSFGLGGVIGSLGLSTLLQRVPTKVLFPLARVGLAVFAAVGAVTTSAPLMVLGVFGMSLCFGAKGVALSTYRFETYEREQVTLISGATRAALNAGLVVGSVVSGLLLSALGIGASGWIAFGGIAVGAATSYRLFRVRPDRLAEKDGSGSETNPASPPAVARPDAVEGSDLRSDWLDNARASGSGRVDPVMMSLAANGHNVFRGRGIAGLREVERLVSTPIEGFESAVGNIVWVLESPKDASGQAVVPGHAYVVHYHRDEQGRVSARKIDRSYGIDAGFDVNDVAEHVDIHAILIDPGGNAADQLYDQRPELDGEGTWTNPLGLELLPYTPRVAQDIARAHRHADTAAG
jgi:MFS family permease